MRLRPVVLNTEEYSTPQFSTLLYGTVTVPAPFPLRMVCSRRCTEGTPGGEEGGDEHCH